MRRLIPHLEIYFVSFVTLSDIEKSFLNLCLSPGAVPNNHQPKSGSQPPAAWGCGPQKTTTTFEFNQPTKVDDKHKK